MLNLGKAQSEVEVESGVLCVREREMASDQPRMILTRFTGVNVLVYKIPVNTVTYNIL